MEAKSIYEEKIHLLTQTLLQQQQQHLQTSTHCTQLQQENEWCKGQINQQQTQIVELVKRQEQTEKDFKKSQSDLAMTSNFLKLKQSMIDAKERLNQEMKKEIEELKRQLAKKDEEKEKTKEQGQESVGDLRAKVQSLLILKQQAEETKGLMQQNLERMDKMITEKDQEIDKINQEAIHLNQTLEVKINHIEQSTKEHEEYQAKSNEIINKLRKQREELLESKVNLKQENDKNLQDQRISYEAQIQQLNEQHSIEVLQLQSLISDLNRDIEHLQARLSFNPESSIQEVPQVAGNDFTSQLTEQIKLIKQASSNHSRHQQKEIELVMQITNLQRENGQLKHALSQINEMDELSFKVNVLEEQLREAGSVNEYLTQYYQQTKSECQTLKQRSFQLEKVNQSLQQQLEESFYQVMDKQQATNLVNLLINRTFMTVKQLIQKSSSSLDQQQFISQLKNLENDRLKEKKLLSKLIKQLRKSIQSIDQTKKLDNIFEYLQEQLGKLKDCNYSQQQFFKEFASQIKPLDQEMIIESYKTQNTILENQVEIVQSQNESYLKELTHLKELKDKSEQENTKKQSQQYELRKDLITHMGIIEQQQQELQSLREKSRILQSQLKQKSEELTSSQADHQRLIDYLNKMSLVRNEYTASNIDANYTKMLDNLAIQNQELKIREQQLLSKVQELEGMISIIKEDSNVVKNQYDKLLNADVTMRNAAPNQRPSSQDQETQTMKQIDQELVDLFLSQIDSLENITVSLESQIEEIIGLYYAYSRSENKSDDKKIELENELQKNKDIAQSYKEKIEKQHKFILQQKEKMQQLQSQLATSSQQQQQPQRVVVSNVVQSNQQTQQLNQKLDAQAREKQQSELKFNQRIEQLLKEKQTLEALLSQQKSRISEVEQLLSRIRAESQFNMKTMQNKNNELKKELERVQKGESIQQMPTNQVVSTLMRTLKKTQKVLIAQEDEIEELKQQPGSDQQTK